MTENMFFWTVSQITAVDVCGSQQFLIVTNPNYSKVTQNLASYSSWILVIIHHFDGGLQNMSGVSIKTSVKPFTPQQW